MAKNAPMRRPLGGLKLTRRKLMTMCLGGILFLASGQADAIHLGDGLLRRNLMECTGAGEEVSSAGIARARAASVESNVVKCAYGQHSNPQPLQVELTHDNNAVMLECGSNHVLEPTNYSTNYCEDGTLTTCTKSFKEVLPNFTDSWWTEGSKPKESAKLTIPPREFPAADFKFYVGCKLDRANGSTQRVSREKSPSQPEVGSLTCRVVVTIKAATSASVAPTLAVGAAASGAVSITRFLAEVL
ncbi:SAG-related sequence [Besnoitia besnoiti]|uniref:SAG-related sequence n=1 Tax=Besnoitia besnoiti TaxID=94643 RepID=A0A2A9M9I2_BESBE|nr:SAG-related sequence [Besnoitia besnoiti]PFH33864.1 SAG-related sequence [Besnoitia besnoiti]